MAKLTFTSDFADSPYRVAYDISERLYVVVEVETGAELGWFERGEYQRAYEICAAHNSDSAAVADADYAVYCEACGHEVDPAEAVLDGELMVCPGCAPCSAAEFEAMLQAEADALAAPVPDPEAWQAVSAVPCEPVDAESELDRRERELAARCDCFALGIEQPACLAAGRPLCEPRQWPIGAAEDNPATHPYLMTGSLCAPEHRCDLSRELSRRAIFDALCQAADELRDYWRDVPRRVEAINVAWEWVMLQPVYHFNAQGDLLVPSSSKAGVVYAVGHTCPCTAGRWGNHCKHSIVGDILGRAVRISRLKAA